MKIIDILVIIVIEVMIVRRAPLAEIAIIRQGLQAPFATSLHDSPIHVMYDGV